jgi:hypothetical protein
MLDLTDQMYGLELRSKQLRIHLTSLDKAQAEARAVSAELADMRRQIKMLLGKCVDTVEAVERPSSRRLH